METLYLLIIGVLILLAGISLYRYLRLTTAQPPKKPEQKKQPQHDFKQELADDITTFPAWEKKQPPADPVLPARYNRDKLVLMVRDAHWLYAYWELTPEKLQQHPACQDNQLLLRLYDVTMLDYFDGTNAHGYQDIIISSYSNNWHIAVQTPDRSYCVDLGYLLKGRFITLLRSNRVYTPRVTVSSVLDEQWLPLDALYSTTSRCDVSSKSFTEQISNK